MQKGKKCMLASVRANAGGIAIYVSTLHARNCFATQAMT